MEAVMVNYLRRHRLLFMESLFFSIGVAATFMCLYTASAGNRTVDNSPLVPVHQQQPR
jgi:hypothetical protein